MVIYLLHSGLMRGRVRDEEESWEVVAENETKKPHDSSPGQKTVSCQSEISHESEEVGAMGVTMGERTPGARLFKTRQLPEKTTASRASNDPVWRRLHRRANCPRPLVLRVTQHAGISEGS
jgi:hypothetical protein